MDKICVSFRRAVVGDMVMRLLAGVPCPLKVTEITDTLIRCGPWEFDRATGAEIDDLLNWGAPPEMTGSFLLD
jgi:hypothetical protein